MANSFVPLILPAGASAESAPFRLTVLSQADSKPAFAPLPALPGAHPGAESCGKPSVVVQRNGDVISTIRIQCTCGQVIELSCAY